MKAKKVRETMNEQWVSSNTGIENYADNISYSPKQQMYPQRQNEPIEEPEEEAEQNVENINPQDLINNGMIPPPNIKLTPEEFRDYINQLIEFIPQSPGLAFKIFNVVLRLHSYLTKKPIGFNILNPYESTINDFKIKFNQIINR